MTQTPLKLFNSLTRRLETFTPVHPGEARVYSCGPTVYNYPHIGNMRAYVFADTLGRTLSAHGYKLTHVINITDVGHLTDDADARKLGELATSTDVKGLRSLQDPTLIQAFVAMTDCIRNVDVNHVGQKVSDALGRVEQARSQASGSAQVMLDLMREKFGVLNAVPSGRYDMAYFRLQLEIIRVLLEHRLFMQAYTALRELLGSVGMAGLPKDEYSFRDLTNKRARNYRLRFAEAFVGMLQHPRDKWQKQPASSPTDRPDPVKDRETLSPWFTKLEEAGIITEETRTLAKEITKIRNGFDHAWTAEAVDDRIEAKGRNHLECLEKIVALLGEQNLLPTDKEEGK